MGGIVEMDENKIEPEDIVRLILKNLKIWKTVDKIEDNLKKMLWYFEDERYDKLAEEFDLEID